MGNGTIRMYLGLKEHQTSISAAFAKQTMPVMVTEVFKYFENSRNCILQSSDKESTDADNILERVWTQVIDAKGVSNLETIHGIKLDPGKMYRIVFDTSLRSDETKSLLTRCQSLKTLAEAEK